MKSPSDALLRMYPHGYVEHDSAWRKSGGHASGVSRATVLTLSYVRALVNSQHWAQLSSHPPPRHAAWEQSLLGPCRPAHSPAQCRRDPGQHHTEQKHPAEPHLDPRPTEARILWNNCFKPRNFKVICLMIPTRRIKINEQSSVKAPEKRLYSALGPEKSDRFQFAF